jgi:hypothetical protein
MVSTRSALAPCCFSAGRSDTALQSSASRESDHDEGPQTRESGRGLLERPFLALRGEHFDHLACGHAADAAVDVAELGGGGAITFGRRLRREQRLVGAPDPTAQSARSRPSRDARRRTSAPT